MKKRDNAKAQRNQNVVFGIRGTTHARKTRIVPTSTASLRNQFVTVQAN